MEMLLPLAFLFLLSHWLVGPCAIADSSLFYANEKSLSAALPQSPTR